MGGVVKPFNSCAGIVCPDGSDDDGGGGGGDDGGGGGGDDGGGGGGGGSTGGGGGGGGDDDGTDTPCVEGNFELSCSPQCGPGQLVYVECYASADICNKNRYMVTMGGLPGKKECENSFLGWFGGSNQDAKCLFRSFKSKYSCDKGSEIPPTCAEGYILKSEVESKSGQTWGASANGGKLGFANTSFNDPCVSWTCWFCEEEPGEEPGCCMYPASGLDADPGYTVDDFPENLLIQISDEEAQIEMSKISAVSFPSFDDYTFYTGYYSGSGYYIALCVEGDRDAVYWVIGIDDDGFNAIRLVDHCLVTGDGGLVGANDRVEDQFEPTYDLTAFGSSAGDVTRSSLCHWMQSSTVTYDFFYDEITYKWKCERTGPGFPVLRTFLKQDPQSSPVGIYEEVGGSGTLELA
jgi:hypothetical protein